MKLKCIESIYSIDFKGIRTIMNKGDVVISKVMSKEGYCEIFTMDGEYITKITNELMQKYFEPYIEAECTVTKDMDKLRDLAEEYLDNKMKTRELFKGWDIIRLITEGKLKEGTRLYDNTTTCSCTYEAGCLIDECEEEVNMDYIIHGEFEIDEPVELVTFKEALNKKLKIRHKDWDSSISFTTPQNALSFMARYKEEEIDNMLYEDRCWEVQSND